MRMNRYIALALAALIVAALVLPAEAFDNKRKGFVIGIGLGAGAVNYRQVAAEMGSSGTVVAERDWEQRMSFPVDFKIGGGVNDKLLIYYSSRVAWLGVTDPLNNKVTINSGIHGLGAAYYFKPEGPSWFLSGVIGVATWSGTISSDPEFKGPGFQVGLGWEFQPHFALEATLSYGETKAVVYGFDTGTDAASLLVTIGALGY